jgi:hypothetical protein
MSPKRAHMLKPGRVDFCDATSELDSWLVQYTLYCWQHRNQSRRRLCVQTEWEARFKTRASLLTGKLTRGSLPAAALPSGARGLPRWPRINSRLFWVDAKNGAWMCNMEEKSSAEKQTEPRKGETAGQAHCQSKPRFGMLNEGQRTNWRDSSQGVPAWLGPPRPTAGRWPQG